MEDNFAFLLPLFMAVFGIVFLVLRGKGGGAAAQYWGIGFLSAAAAFSIPLLSLVPVEIRSVVVNLLFLLAFFSYGEAISLQFSLHPLRGLRLCLCALCLPPLLYAIHTDDMRTEIILSDLTCGLLILIPFCRALPARKTWSDRLLVTVVGAVVIETFLRLALFTLLTSSLVSFSLRDYFQSPYAFYVQLGASVIGFLLALSALAAITTDIIARYRTAAEQDPLTGLLNRRGFELQLENPRIAAEGGAVIMADIDFFKRINDRFGHMAGDMVIAEFARLIGDNAVPDMICARYGGEEFVMLLPSASLTEAQVRAEVLRRTLASRHWSFDADGGPITASFGVAAIGKGPDAIRAAIQQADHQLYVAKGQGRNRVAVEGLAPIGSKGLTLVTPLSASTAS
ncbi:GGDEF domain-containing protein [Rhizobium sp. CSW-27]|uniref:GGDEF domain-containing protein n=1 Tax=Rhizobium sp. CSW-27 TaxID=2839985 RepID=UPI001C017980|nr:GGDEF domain-containing protein [Rhizobium sp. CSW-27]